MRRVREWQRTSRASDEGLEIARIAQSRADRVTAQQQPIRNLIVAGQRGPYFPALSALARVLQRRFIMLNYDDRGALSCTTPRPLADGESRADIAALLSRYLPDWTRREAESDADGRSSVPAATESEVRQSGLLTLPIPTALGGSGVSLFACTELVRQVARVAPATALCLVMPLGNAANTLVPDSAVAIGARAALAAGRQFIAQNAAAGRILAVANSEPGAGGALENTRTRAQRDASGVYRLTGEKGFATWGAAADYFLCSARTEDGALDAFFVPRDAVGVTLHDDWDALGMRASASVSLSLENAPAAQRFLHPGAIAGASARHWSTVLLSAVFLGVGEGALDAARAGVANSPGYAQSTLAESVLSLEAACGLIEAVARADRVPADAFHRERCQRAKTFAARSAVEAATRSLIVSGGRAYRPRHLLARFLHAALAGPLVRPPLPGAMDAIASTQFELRG